LIENYVNIKGSGTLKMETKLKAVTSFVFSVQVATDDQGRRRFHGAFMGGFSAGYFNSVGSKEGWKPKEFVSSR